jgi:hypothetical protein
MLDQLLAVLPSIPTLLDTPLIWDSLIVNRRKPFTYRVFTKIGDTRVCLHKFNACDRHEAFKHPHPWPGAFMVLEGAYRMWIGSSPDRTSPPVDVAEFQMTKFSAYEITDPRTWHSVVPLCDTYTIMVNGPAWDKDTVAHVKTVTTAGKDLDKMPPDDLKEHLEKFKVLIGEWLKSQGL